MYNVRRDDVYTLKLAGFLTEFGNAGEGQAAEDVIDFAMAKMDEIMHGWTYWYLTPDPEVTNSTVIRALARPYPQKISGDPLYYHLNPKEKSLKWSTRLVSINLVLIILRKHSHQRRSEAMSMIPCRCCTFKRSRLIQTVRLN